MVIFDLFLANKPFFKDSTDLTTQYFLLIFDMLIQVNQRYLFTPFLGSAIFLFLVLKMAFTTKTSSRPQLSLKLVHTKGSGNHTMHHIKYNKANFQLRNKPPTQIHTKCTWNHLQEPTGPHL